jgi:cytidyltransferase-like protein
MDEQDPLYRLSRRAGTRLGIMGGAFDPIHIAHLVTAEEALMQFGLHEVVFMPAGNPPHKTLAAPRSPAIACLRSHRQPSLFFAVAP